MAETIDIRELNERIERQSAFVPIILRAWTRFM